jgi:hypothetical protein
MNHENKVNKSSINKNIIINIILIIAILLLIFYVIYKYNNNNAQDINIMNLPIISIYEDSGLDIGYNMYNFK